MNQYILGIGCNQGDLLNNLREALKALELQENLSLLAISPVYRSDAQLPENHPESWDQSYLNLAMLCETTLNPSELLATIKWIEENRGRKNKERWAPRIIDIDVLAWDKGTYSDEQITIPHRSLIERPFALWPLLDLWPDWQHPEHRFCLKEWGEPDGNQAPFRTQRIAQHLTGPRLVGILNISPESFSQDGLTKNKSILEKATQLFKAGAEIIDIGAQSTHPDSKQLSPEEEWKRLEPVLAMLSSHWKSASFKPKISIDTYRAEIVKKALVYSIDWVNDVSGEQLPEIIALIKNRPINYVSMHNLGVPPSPENHLPQDGDPVKLIIQWAENKIMQLLKLGLKKEKLILDIGIGFGKTREQSWRLIQNAGEFNQLDAPILIGHSRKGFLMLTTENNKSDRDIETADISRYLAQQKIAYLRVHNVEMNRQRILRKDGAEERT